MYGDQFGELLCGYWGLKVNRAQPCITLTKLKEFQLTVLVRWLTVTVCSFIIGVKGIS